MSEILLGHLAKIFHINQSPLHAQNAVVYFWPCDHSTRSSFELRRILHQRSNYRAEIIFNTILYFASQRIWEQYASKPSVFLLILLDHSTGSTFSVTSPAVEFSLSTIVQSFLLQPSLTSRKWLIIQPIICNTTWRIFSCFLSSLFFFISILIRINI